jgi:hypothetical protein
MTQSIGRLGLTTVHVFVLAAALAAAPPVQASRWEARREFREGQREIARERRDILRADSPREARRAYREGQAEIARERREMRREVGRELRYGRWDRDRDRVGDVVAGVALGAVIVAVARGVSPTPPSPELCWFWTDVYQERGYWDRCGGYAGY